MSSHGDSEPLFNMIVFHIWMILEPFRLPAHVSRVRLEHSYKSYLVSSYLYVREFIVRTHGNNEYNRKENTCFHAIPELLSSHFVSLSRMETGIVKKRQKYSNH